MSDETNAPPAAPAEQEANAEVKPAAPETGSPKGPMVGPRGPNNSYTDSRAE